MDKIPTNPYKIDRLAKIPAWIKVNLLKWWIAGAIYYFIGFGLLFTLSSFIDLVVYMGLAIGIINEYIIKNIILWMERENLSLGHYIEIESKGIKGVVLNFIFGIIISIIIAFTYEGINAGLIQLLGRNQSEVIIGTEPVLFGLFYVIYSTIYLQIKRKIFQGGK